MLQKSGCPSPWEERTWPWAWSLQLPTDRRRVAAVELCYYSNIFPFEGQLRERKWEDW